MSQTPCPDCGGKRLRPEILAVTVGGKSIAEASDLSVLDAQAFFAALTFGEKDSMIAAPILKEINARLRFLIDGSGVFDASRAAGTLSGGEAQRIRLATQIGSSLVGVPVRASFIFWTSPPSACTSATTRGSSKRSSTCAISATR